MPKEHTFLAKAGENLAANFLKAKGYRIIEANYRNKLGEIDLIAEDKDTICFIEVKTRSSERFGLGQEAVSFHKQRQISRVAVSFLKEKNFLERNARFDVVSVLYSTASPKIDLIQNAFEITGGLSY